MRLNHALALEAWTFSKIVLAYTGLCSCPIMAGVSRQKLPTPMVQTGRYFSVASTLGRLDLIIHAYMLHMQSHTSNIKPPSNKSRKVSLLI